jgi:glycosyltransferase involved in cell wall biosynthesis
MRIVIAAVSASEHISGVPRHAVNLARCLLTNTTVLEVHMIVGVWQYEAFCAALPRNDTRLTIHRALMGNSALTRNYWYYVTLPQIASSLKADVVHLTFPVPLNRNAYHCPTVVSLHDLYPYDIPTNFGFPKVFYNQLILKQCLKSADVVACVSESTRSRLDFHEPMIARQKAITIYNSVEHGPPMTTSCPLPDWHGEPFFLCVAQHRKNKNILLALQIFERLLLGRELQSNARLVVVGIDGPDTKRIKSFIQDQHLSHNVVLLRGVSDAQLQWFYGHCELLLAPSLIEGFGLPIVEAMLCHCPVVCSDIPAFREVGAPSCYYASLQDSHVDNFVRMIRLARKSARSHVIHPNRFSSLRIADSYLELYGRLARRNAVGQLALELSDTFGNIERHL